MDKPLLALPYHGPSCSVDVLERVVKRDLVRHGRAWSDLSFAHRCGYLDEAQSMLRGAIQMVLADPAMDISPHLLTDEIRSGAIQTFSGLLELNKALVHLEIIHHNQASSATYLRRVFS